MEMTNAIKILMVEDDELVCDAYERAVRNFDNMKIAYTTDSETQAMQYVLEHSGIDAILLDLELREGDGISFLMQLNAQYFENRPYVMVVTNTASSLMLSLVREYGGDFIYQKNNAMYTEMKVLSMVEKAVPYKREKNKRLHSMSTSIQDELIRSRESKRYIYHSLTEIGFKAGMLGTAYLQDIIYMAVREHLELDDTRVKALYEETAKLNHTNSSNVERNIRSAIELTWEQTRLDNIQRYYPFSWSEKKGKPTNKEFVINMVRLLSQNDR